MNEASFLRRARHDGRQQKLDPAKGGIEPGVLGFVDHAHAAFAELGEDFVMRDGFADHGHSIAFFIAILEF
jgi:hypothetical protein